MTQMFSRNKKSALKHKIFYPENMAAKDSRLNPVLILVDPGVSVIMIIIFNYFHQYSAKKSMFFTKINVMAIFLTK
jgi:hypothetical protein